MNPTAILALISSLYDQIVQQQSEIESLKALLEKPDEIK